MKKVLLSLLAFFIVFFLFYLIGCFYNVSFNLNDWSKESRMVTSLFGSMFSLITSLIVIDRLTN